VGYVEDAFEVRTKYGKRRVLARRGRAAEKRRLFQHPALSVGPPIYTYFNHADQDRVEMSQHRHGSGVASFLKVTQLT
jgi:hypothetical protein